jgi:hypothetical protein
LVVVEQLAFIVTQPWIGRIALGKLAVAGMAFLISLPVQIAVITVLAAQLIIKVAPLPMKG